MNDWSIKCLVDCIDRVQYPNKIPKKKFLDDGDFPIISQEKDLINGYWSNKDDVFSVLQPIVIFGDHTKVLKFIDFDFVIGADGVKVLQPKSFLDPKYFYYYLNAFPVKSLGYARHYRLLKELDIKFPPLPEQKRIVAILDEAFAGIAQSVANAEKNLANARELFESYLKSVFTQKGESWQEKPLKDVCVLQRGFDLPKRLRLKGNFPLVSSSGIIDAHIEAKVVGPGVATGRSGSIGNVFYIEQDFWPLNTVLYVKEFHGNIQRFIYYLLKQFEVVYNILCKF